MANPNTVGSPALARRADEVRNYRWIKKLTLTVMACIFILLTIIYVISIMYSRYGGFTVSVNKYQQIEYGLSLSETRDFLYPTSHLECRASEDITNIDGKILQQFDLGAVDGEDSGQDYLCYTFYCKNVGQKAVTYEYSIDISKMTLDIEKAVRVRLISNINGKGATSVDYARAAGVDENGNSIPEPGTVAFFNKNTVVRKQVEEFMPDDVIKYTVVIWLEGNDPECIDDILGGEFKVDMKISVVSVTDTE